MSSASSRAMSCEQTFEIRSLLTVRIVGFISSHHETQGIRRIKDTNNRKGFR